MGLVKSFHYCSVRSYHCHLTLYFLKLMLPCLFFPLVICNMNHSAFVGVTVLLFIDLFICFIPRHTSSAWVVQSFHNPVLVKGCDLREVECNFNLGNGLKRMLPRSSNFRTLLHKVQEDSRTALLI